MCVSKELNIAVRALENLDPGQSTLVPYIIGPLSSKHSLCLDSHIQIPALITQHPEMTQDWPKPVLAFPWPEIDLK